MQNADQLREIRTFPQLVKYLKTELDWPIDTEDFEELTFEYSPEELGLDAKAAVKIKEIKQLRPLAANQPWGIFFVNFEPKRLPVVVLRRILSALVIKKRQSANKAQQAAWRLNDLLFISSYGESEHRDITFANFSEDPRYQNALPVLKVLGWDDEDTAWHLSHAHETLKEKLHWPSNTDDLESWRDQWSEAFTSRHREVITTSKALATTMAKLAISIRKRVNKVLSVESENGPICKLMNAFKETLIHDLKSDDFADMYAQTITYGLLSARVSRPLGIDAENIKDMVPITNPFLRDLLSEFLTAGGRKGAIDFDELGINEVVDLLNSEDTDMEAILRDFNDLNPEEDPVIHFYELFLKEYDSRKKIERGVFYTPRPVVSFIIHSVHEILQKEFGLEDGLADTSTWEDLQKRFPDLKIPKGFRPKDPFVKILDPACGTGTFLVEAIDLIHKTMLKKWEKQGYLQMEIPKLWNEYVPDHLLPRLYGFELMMAPYAVAHMKLGLKLNETGYKFHSHERASIYLTNTLDEVQDFSDQFEIMAPALAHEAHAVNVIKRHHHFTVIVGNPPYALTSANMNPEHRALVERFKFVGSEKIQERGALQLEKILNDDYVKFVAKSMDLLSASGFGVLGLITNHAYLDNPTMRGLRHNLMMSFRYVFLYDLGGSAKKASDEINENVFNIQQGVSIGIFVKNGLKDKGASCKHARLNGTRETKYSKITSSSISSTKWGELSPKAPFFLFIPMDYELSSEYEQFIPLSDVFVLKSIGLFTSKDSLVIDWSSEIVERKVRLFQKSALSNTELCDQVGITAKKAWNITKSRDRLRSIRNIGQYIVKFLHRPFDYKYIFYEHSLVWSMAWPVNRNLLLGKNLALVVSRQLATPPWNHVFCSNTIVELCYITNKTKEGNHVFPLYVEPDNEDNKLSIVRQKVREPNFHSSFLRRASEFLKLQSPDQQNSPRSIAPEDIFYYMYAVFHSPAYRHRYSEFLKMDFPRLPLTSNKELFKNLCMLGEELVHLHLMEKFGPCIASFPIKGLNPVEKIKYVPPFKKETGKVWINNDQYFEAVPPKVWEFHIGGYQVCEKWLKDRKGRMLSEADVQHYQRIVSALQETIRIMAEIDKAIDSHGGWPIK